LEHLSVASFLGKLLVFPANVRLGWKVIASTNKTLAYLASSTVTKEKCFTTLKQVQMLKKLFWLRHQFRQEQAIVFIPGDNFQSNQ
jgi:hypothetical protein